jgi:hypothetical protein
MSTDLLQFANEDHLELGGDPKIAERLHQIGANGREQRGLESGQLVTL